MGRDRWKSTGIFILAAVGSAIGLGNLWRFPYLAYEYGGGAFLIPYLIALFVLGIPLLILEFSLGQHMQKGAVDAFAKIGKKFAAVGWWGIFAAFIILSYYAVVLAWAIIYIFYSFSMAWKGNAEAFFFENVLQLSEGVHVTGSPVLPIVLALALVWIIVYFCVWKGTESVSKVIKWTVWLPVALLGVILLRVITLPGFLDGWAYYLRPDFTALLDTTVWITAISQIFFTLSIAFGIMIAYASYNNKKHDITKSAYKTALFNSGFSIFAGFIVFGTLGFMAAAQQVAVPDVVTSGPGLTFVVFPEALSLMPAAPIFAILFFVVLLLLGVDSAFSLVEAVSAVIKDKVAHFKSQHIAAAICVAGFFSGLIYTTNAGLYFLDIVDHFITNFGLVAVGLLEAIVIGYIFKAAKMRKYINEVSHKKVGAFWEVAIRYIVPIALIVVLVSQFLVEIKTPYGGYPIWAISVGWAAVLGSLAVALFLSFTSKA